MAAGPKIDGAGIQKLKTLDEAVVQLQRLHSVVEHYALALKQNKPTHTYSQHVKRTLTPLVGKLKPQFGMISDVVAAMNLVAGRGGSEKTKVRMLQEGVGSIRQQLDIAVVRVKENHAVKDDAADSPQPPTTSG